jgi:hypothetical protein
MKPFNEANIIDKKILKNLLEENLLKEDIEDKSYNQD